MHTKRGSLPYTLLVTMAGQVHREEREGLGGKEVTQSREVKDSLTSLMTHDGLLVSPLGELGLPYFILTGH